MNFSTHVPDLQLALRASLASGVAVGAAQLLELQYPLYAMIATVLVTDLSPVQTRKLGVVRLVGTVLGALLGAVVSLLLPSGPAVIFLSVFLAMMVSRLLNLQQAARVAGYVCGIVILNHGSHPWSYAVYRTLETVLGIGVAVLVSLVPKLLSAEEAKLESQEKGD